MPSPLAEAHVEAQSRLRDVVANSVLTIWDALPNHDRENVDTFLNTALPLVEAGQRHSVALLDGFWADERSQVPTGVDPADVVGSGARKGADPREVYQRPFVLLWHGLKVGKLWEAANKEARARLDTVVRTDLLLSQMQAAAELVRLDPEVRSLERVLKGTCDLCTDVAADHTITQPVHPGCECSVAPSTQKPGTRAPRPLDAVFGDRKMEPATTSLRSEHRPEGAWWDEADLIGLSDYLGSWGSFRINEVLREFDVIPADSEVADQVANIDDTLAKAGPIGEWVDAWRGQSSLPRQLGLDPDHMVGTTFTDRGYGSTTTALSTADQRAMGMIMELHVDPRVRAVWGANPTEDELLLERGVRYIIKRAEPTGEGSKWRVECDVLPPL